MTKYDGSVRIAGTAVNEEESRRNTAIDRYLQLYEIRIMRL